MVANNTMKPLWFALLPIASACSRTFEQWVRSYSM